jgi:hypothetical protein
MELQGISAEFFGSKNVKNAETALQNACIGYNLNFGAGSMRRCVLCVVDLFSVG